MALALIGSVMASAGVVLVYAALFLWLEQTLSPAAAALLTGVAVLASAGMIALVWSLSNGGLRRKSTPRGGIGALINTAVAPGAAGGERSRITLPVIAAALAVGFALGASPELRVTLWQMLSGAGKGRRT